MANLETAFKHICMVVGNLKSVDGGPGNDSKAKTWWEKITELYSEPQRHYHTITHIEAMFEFWKSYKHELQQPTTVMLATIFHDIIYNPKAGDNEEQSVETFEEFAKDISLPPDVNAVVSDLIIKTKAHKTDVHLTNGAYGDGDEHYFLDFDMSVLGWPTEKYKIYAGQIRQEYSHVPEEIFREKREEALRSFLLTPNIFATREFRDLFEHQARQNIEEEIVRLQD